MSEVLRTDSIDYAVVIPTRGRRDMLLVALESVYGQTIAPSQVIVVVDGDIDGSADAVQERYSDVSLIVHKRATGAARARTEGIAAASAEWVCLLDDDDVWHSEKQAIFARYLRRNPNCGALRSPFWQFAEDSAATELNGFRTEIFSPGVRSKLETAARTAVLKNDFAYLDIYGHSVRELLRKNCGVTSSTMVRREILQRIPEVPAELQTAEDWLLFVYVAKVAEWHLVPERTFFYRIHSGQDTQKQGTPKWSSRTRAWGEAWKQVGIPNGFELRDYAEEYAGELHRWVWEALSRRDLAEARAVYREGSQYVDSRTFRTSVFLPPPIRARMRTIISKLVR